MDKAFWRSIVNANYAAPASYSVATLTTELLTKLGSTDPVWRDELAYPILEHWIHRGYYSASELRELAAAMLANLRIGIGEFDDDTVFLRSFSMLVLMEIVGCDNEMRVLSAADAHTYLDAGLAYLADECDLRGYVPERGWAHAVAHTADLLMMLARSRRLAEPDLVRILDGIANKIGERVPHVYLHAEDERMAHAAMCALRRDLLGMAHLRSWLDRLSHHDGRRWTPDDIHAYEGACAYANIRAFLRSLYFQLALAENPPVLASALLSALTDALRVMDFGFYALP